MVRVDTLLVGFWRLQLSGGRRDCRLCVFDAENSVGKFCEDVAVGHENYRRAALQRSNGLEDPGGAGDVERAGRFVEHEQRRPAIQRSRDREALPLSARQSRTLFAASSATIGSDKKSVVSIAARLGFMVSFSFPLAGLTGVR